MFCGVTHILIKIDDILQLCYNTQSYEMNKNNQKRYTQDSLDFIIPFLINQSTDYEQLRQEKKKKLSAPSRVREVNINSSISMLKIYKGSKQEKSAEKSSKKVKLESAKFQFEEQVISKLQLSLNKSPYIARNRFFKTHSVVNHLPVSNMNEVAQFKISPPKAKEDKEQSKEDKEDSPIPGVRFRKKSKFNESANLIAHKLNSDDFHQHKGEVFTNMKYFKQKKEWNRKRSVNVDFIINRKCKTFNDLILQYRKRLSIEQIPNIFIFNSKDLWLKRILLERGWIQNENKESRAFHLYWSNKIYKEKLFPEQLMNHYRNSDMITSKAGLHRMLAKYGLTHLQPKTFDLTLQRNQFELYFIKLTFLKSLRTFISKFQFEDQPLYKNFEGIRRKYNQIKAQKAIFSRIQSNLLILIENCFNLIKNKIERISNIIEEILFSINEFMRLTNLEEELVRILRDFQCLIRRQKAFQRDLEMGNENIWLTKSKNSSKGVGISLHKDFDDIMKHQNRLAQKYIENPLIFKDSVIKGRKFDIRVWVLLTGNNRPTLYYHPQFYGRLCYESYSLETINLDNQKKHLTNYSQNKIKFKDQNLADSIVLPERIFQLLKKERNIDFKQAFYAKMQGMLQKLSPIFKNEIAEGSLNSFQLFGLDWLIDDNLDIHLLEVNLSAACEERHQGLKDMLENIGHGMLNILESNPSVRGWVLIK